MRFRIIVASAIALSFVLSGCGSGPANTENTGTNANVNVVSKPAASDQATNDAPTLTPLLKAYCDARLKNDEAALRKIYTQDTLRSFEEQMKSDNIKTLVEFLQDEKVSADRCEVKNERITGDTAVAKIYLDSYPNGFDVYFEKEKGEWKMTNKSPTFEAGKLANANKNTAK
jgi:predicted lipid-binding transport protein (Tim44 family)